MVNLFYQKMLTDPEKALNELVRDAVREELSSFKVTYQSPTAPVEVVFLSRKEAAHFLKISLTQIYYLQRQGKLRSFRVGKKVFFKKEDLLSVYLVQERRSL